MGVCHSLPEENYLKPSDITIVAKSTKGKPLAITCSPTYQLVATNTHLEFHLVCQKTGIPLVLTPHWTFSARKNFVYKCWPSCLSGLGDTLHIVFDYLAEYQFMHHVAFSVTPNIYACKTIRYNSVVPSVLSCDTLENRVNFAIRQFCRKHVFAQIVHPRTGRVTRATCRFVTTTWPLIGLIYERGLFGSLFVCPVMHFDNFTILWHCGSTSDRQAKIFYDAETHNKNALCIRFSSNLELIYVNAVSTRLELPASVAPE